MEHKSANMRRGFVEAESGWMFTRLFVLHAILLITQMRTRKSDKATTRFGNIEGDVQF